MTTNRQFNLTVNGTTLSLDENDFQYMESTNTPIDQILSKKWEEHTQKEHEALRRSYTDLADYPRDNGRGEPVEEFAIPWDDSLIKEVPLEEAFDALKKENEDLRMRLYNAQPNANWPLKYRELEDKYDQLLLDKEQLRKMYDNRLKEFSRLEEMLNQTLNENKALYERLESLNEAQPTTPRYRIEKLSNLVDYWRKEYDKATSAIIKWGNKCRELEKRFNDTKSLRDQVSRLQEDNKELEKYRLQNQLLLNIVRRLYSNDFKFA